MEEIARAGDKAGKVFWSGLDKRLAPSPEGRLGGTGTSDSPNPPVHRAELALFLFLSADPGIKPQRSEAVRRQEVRLFGLPATRDHLTASRGGATLRRLLVAWLTGPRNVEPAGAELSRFQQALRAAAAAGATEVRPVVQKIAFDPGQPVYARAAALVALQDLGESDDIRALEALRHDDSLVGTFSDGGANSTATALGDLALAACVRLAGKELKDFGFVLAERAKMEGADALYFGFPDSASRAAARKKWTELAADRKLSPGGKP
jgi:hypothetical protein